MCFLVHGGRGGGFVDCTVLGMEKDVDVPTSVVVYGESHKDDVA